MTENQPNLSQDIQEPSKLPPGSTSLAFRSGLFIIFLISSLLIVCLGSNYYKLFPTNGSVAYSAVLSAIFLIAALVFKRIEKFSRYWSITYAFFIASAVNLVSALFAGYNGDILRALGLSPDTNQGLALAKLYDAFLVVIPIILLTLLSGADLGSLFLKKGNLKLGLGIGSLVFANFLTSVLIFFGTSFDSQAKLGSAILWSLVFAFSNGFLEELWFRGLFLKKLVPLIGVTGSVLLTSTWFALFHVTSVAYLPSVVVPIFLVNTFTMGIACSVLMIKTDSIWGSALIHAAANVFLFVATLAYH
jgi:membrane protease YdiL (CAAX protease family)